MILVARTQTEKQMERKIIGGEKNIYIKEITISAMNCNVRNGYGKEILNSPLNKFLILALKIYS